jgi:hypothetical protein
MLAAYHARFGHTIAGVTNEGWNKSSQDEVAATEAPVGHDRKALESV